MNRVVHFEVRADDVERATAFYQAAFGWSAQDGGGNPLYRFLVTGPEGTAGIDGAITQRKAGDAPVEVAIEVADVSAAMQRVSQAGGRVLGGTRTMPGVGVFAHILDSEGNAFTLIQRLETDV